MGTKVNMLSALSDIATVLNGRSTIPVNYYVGRNGEKVSQGLTAMSATIRNTGEFKAYAEAVKSPPGKDATEEETEKYNSKVQLLLNDVHAIEIEKGEEEIDIDFHKIKESKLPETICDGATILSVISPPKTPEGGVPQQPPSQARQSAERLARIFGADVTFDKVFAFFLQVTDSVIEE